MYKNKYKVPECIQRSINKKLLIADYKPNIIIYDIESAGVNALFADLGYMINFGYISLDDFLAGKKPTVLSIVDYPTFKQNPHDDTLLVKEALKILSGADGIIHHYGTKFDKPFIKTRALIKNLDTFPEAKELDTCFLSYKQLRLSNNRLVTVAKALKCKNQKLDKKDGWPNWWLDYLKGSPKSDKQMREYCGMDVLTLAEISVRIRRYWPEDFINRLYPKVPVLCKHEMRFLNSKIQNRLKFKCLTCGNPNLESKGTKVRKKTLVRVYQCKNCFSVKNYEKLK